MKKYVDVIVPLPIASQYTYSLPAELEESVHEGCRVVVPFGRKKFYTAIVTRVHYVAPEGYETKDIEEVLDSKPVLLPKQFEFWEWLSTYYLCMLGDVYKAALPSGMKLESETVVVYNEEFEATHPLGDSEQRLLDLLSADKEQCVTQLQRSMGLKNILPVVKRLLDKEAIFVKEDIKRQYKPRTEARVRLANPHLDETGMMKLFDSMGRAKKQLAVLMKYVELSGWAGRGEHLKEVTKKELLEKAGATTTIFNGLVDKGIFEVYYQEIGRLLRSGITTSASHALNPAQQEAFTSILDNFRQKNVCLLHGVTSSGKTEIYIHLIEEALKAGKQVLYLLPEIALTTQITERLKRVFGSRLGVYHSKFPDAERVEIWQKQLGEEEYDVILGVRSSIFLPFKRLGLVIVDEEHENTYKQQDPAPRYNARNAAMILAASFRAKTLLGSATPSIESYHNAKTGKYGLVELLTRHGDIMLPKIEIADTRELRRKKIMTSGDISPQLAEASKSVLDMGGQVILFRNRRGFAPIVECDTCGWTPKCKHCDVTMTYHKHLNQLTCHYCGYTYEIPKKCPACGYHTIETKGFGTEHIEEESANQFKGYPVARMDLDTTRSRKAYEEIISDFESGKTRVLIGTQMITKGLDFERVGVVGILGADSLLNMPDFRAYERAFQMMEQVAGRAGRKGKQGRVIVQTSQADHPIIKQLLTHDYEAMFNEQLAERRDFNYPPFTRLIYIYIKGRNEDCVQRASRWYADLLRQVFGGRVLGPDKPVIGRVQSMYIRKIVLKLENNASPKKVRDIISVAEDNFYAQSGYKSLILYYDADPM